ncbi:hypothetical protein HWE04_14525 [Herbaspirillum sp. C7C2]|uniref:hypothetical protein n=1 Tax=Herbaspirillum sp. C7C2 TaxID=2736666 RepID=UPI001F51F404|nr:hypothetical protein [Herbaspirillum sp. C7C2]MCI1015068.1 hypothetical protein [Herbaspirillum sp. C7C2]
MEKIASHSRDWRFFLTLYIVAKLGRMPLGTRDSAGRAVFRLHSFDSILTAVGNF